MCEIPLAPRDVRSTLAQRSHGARTALARKHATSVTAVPLPPCRAGRRVHTMTAMSPSPAGSRPMLRSSAKTAPAAQAKSAPVRPSAAVAGKRKRTKTATHERVVVTAVIAFGLAAAVLGSVRVAGNVRETRAKELMHGTF